MRCFHLLYASQKQSESSLLKDVGKLSCTNLYNVSVNPNTHYYYFFSSSRPFNLEGGRKRPHLAYRHEEDANAS